MGIAMRRWAGALASALVLQASQSGGGHVEGATPPALRAQYFVEPQAPVDIELEVPPPSAEGKALIRVPGGGEGGAAGGPMPGPTVFLADGAETGLAIDVGNPDNIVAVLNQGFLGTPSVRTSANGNVSWTTRTFPNGGGTYTGSPFDPWVEQGNASGQLFALLIRRDTASPNTHAVIAQSTDSGVSWPLFFEHVLNIFQDRAMLDVDRTAALGGGPGAAHDGKVYLCYDNWGPNFSGYTASALKVISVAGAPLVEVTISTAATFNGSQIQPVAGTTDGQVNLMSLSTSGGGATRILRFHETTGAGAGGVLLNKSSMSFPTTGQPLGTSSRWGVNGHRINAQMFHEIDRTNGPRRGYLYVISNRNPNQANPALDQGDVYLSISTNGALSWGSALLPGLAPGKTQFFAMMDVDDNGWIHVAYYQNESGSVNGGVLNAGSAKVYYTVSINGGLTWAPHVQVNDPANTLDYFDPPPNLAGLNYYLIGDYCQIKATGTGSATRVYVLWTGYDKDRTDMFINDKRERVLCTTITNVVCVGDLDGDGMVGIADFLAVLAAWGTSPPGPPDLDNDGTVGILDFLAVLFHWGACP